MKVRCRIAFCLFLVRSSLGYCDVTVYTTGNRALSWSSGTFRVPSSVLRHVSVTVAPWCYALLSLQFSACHKTSLQNLLKFFVSKCSFFSIWQYWSFLCLIDAASTFKNVSYFNVWFLWTQVTVASILKCVKIVSSGGPYPVDRVGYLHVYCNSSHCLFHKVQLFTFYLLLLPIL